MPNLGQYQTGDTSFLRQLNLAVVMRCLRDCSPIYRAQLAEMTGLNKTTVSSLVSELIAQEFVLESAPGTVVRANSKTGRPAVMLELNPDAGCAVAAEVGVDYLSVAVANFTGTVIWRQTERTRHLEGQHAIVDRLLALLHLALAQGKGATRRVLGIAVGVPALVALESGSVLFAPNLRWQDVPLGRLLREKFACPVYLDNEANLAALAEAKTGAARDHRDVLYISAGVGLGGGVIREGRLYRGVSGLAGEFGHMRVLSGGPADIHLRVCGCGGRGCWETLVSERALFADIRDRVRRGEATVLGWAAAEAHDPRLPGSHVLTIPLVVDAALAGDRVCLAALQTVGQALGVGIASLVNALNPELVVLGGSLSLAGEFLLPAIEKELSEHALKWSRSAVHVVIAQHRFDACVIGGIATVIEASQSGLAHPNALAHASALASSSVRAPESVSNGSTWAGVATKGPEPSGTLLERR